MNIENIWASRPWSGLTSEERTATVRLILQEVAKEQGCTLASVTTNVRGYSMATRDLMSDLAPDVARLLDRVISPGPGPSPTAVAALEGDLKAEAGTY